jgi:hypothetical protein
MRNILLIEPNYKNKYPPIGLMKIATYHRRLGDNVTFFKGKLKSLVVNLLTKDCIQKLEDIDNSINWKTKFDNIFSYIETGKQIYLDNINLDKCNSPNLIKLALDESKKCYKNKQYTKEPLFDRVYIATLFTFYWKITIETINFAKTLVKSKKDVFVGGVSATLLYDDVVKETEIKPIKGLLNKSGMLDKNNKIIVDALPLDYSILEETDYKYPESNAYYGYMTRGCIRKCPFCAVPTLEPEYCEYVPMKEKIEQIRATFGEQRNLLLLDNNVLASPRFPEIIQEIIDCGFGKNATIKESNEYEFALKNLENGLNDSAYTKKLFELNLMLLSRLNGSTEQNLYNLLSDNFLLSFHTTTKENLLKVAPEIFPLYTKHFRKMPKQRYVDFNQGVDARLFTEEKAQLFGKINIRPLRIAFDNINDTKYYENAIRLSAKTGVKHFSNYLLYNFNDKPVDLYKRLKINIDLSEELDVFIYSFPMKFHPITGEDRFNRDFLGKYWNRKYIRAVQAILNSTKGKIARDSDTNDSFFEKAFGKNEEEFIKILNMPETMILYRFFFEWLGQEKNHSVSTQSWLQCWQETFNKLNKQEAIELQGIIQKNKFCNLQDKTTNPKFENLLKFYINYHGDIITEGTEMYKLKQEYNENPTRKLRRKQKK